MDRILVVEDDDVVRRSLARLLKMAGFSVATAQDGVEALEHLQREPFDLVLLDIWMPRMDGMELLARIRSEAAQPRVVAITADNTPETLLRVAREQVYRYVTKPFDAEALIELVRDALAQPPEIPPIEVLSAQPNWVELRVPCCRPAAERIQSFLAQLDADLHPEVRESVGAAFYELLTNAIEWGGQLDPDRKVRIAYIRFDRMLLYRIADPGPGFSFEGLDHAAVISPPGRPLEHMERREEKGLRPGGFGLLMVRANVDELIYNEAQNEVVFVKYLDRDEDRQS